MSHRHGLHSLERTHLGIRGGTQRVYLPAQDAKGHPSARVDLAAAALREQGTSALINLAVVQLRTTARWAAAGEQR